jgi:hypothetical protein
MNESFTATGLIMKKWGYGGGVFEAASAISRILLNLQKLQNIQGDFAEIGVLEGAYTSQLIPFLNKDEICYAIDPYNGMKGLKEPVRKKLAEVCPDNSALEFIYRSSLDVTSESLHRKGSPGIRFFSIDGDHSEKTVLNDLMLARDTIINGGIVAVDDYFDKYSPGVSVAMTRYFMEFNQDRLAILISGGNKVFLTTAQEHLNYRLLLDKYSSIKQSMTHPEVNWHGYPVLFVENILQDHLP